MAEQEIKNEEEKKSEETVAAEKKESLLDMAKNPNQSNILSIIAQKQNEARERVKNYISSFNEDPEHPDPKKRADFEMMKKIAEISVKVFYQAFKIKIAMWEEFFIVLTETWKKMLAELGKQPGDSGAINVHGLQIQYTTQLDEGDKPRNIVPEIIHIKTPIFVIDDEEKSSDKTEEKKEYLNKFSKWLDQNTEDHIHKITTEVDKMLFDDFGLKLVTNIQVVPMCALLYRTAIEKATETGMPINFYNLMTITIREGRIFIEPSSVVKQYIKGDSKFDKSHLD